MLAGCGGCRFYCRMWFHITASYLSDALINVLLNSLLTQGEIIISVIHFVKFALSDNLLNSYDKIFCSQFIDIISGAVDLDELQLH